LKMLVFILKQVTSLCLIAEDEVAGWLGYVFILNQQLDRDW